MRWNDAARQVGVALVVGVSAAALARPAAAQRNGMERSLVGIRLNSTIKTVLQKFGNPNEIVIGDVGVRAPAQTGGAGGLAQGGGFGGMMGPQMGGQAAAMRGGMMGGGMMRGGMAQAGGAGGAGMMNMIMGGPPGGAGMPGGMGGFSPQFSQGAAMRGGMGAGGPAGRRGNDDSDLAGAPMGAMGGPGGGMMGAAGGGLMGGQGAAMRGGMMMGGQAGMMSGMRAGGAGMMGAMGGPGGFGGVAGMQGAAGMSAFGQTTSTLGQQQEVTWIYNRKARDAKGVDNLVSYEFLIGQQGKISQIRVLGYNGGGARTQRGVVLGSTYRDVLRLYGYPEEHVQNGAILIASYKNRSHVQFQFLNEKGQTSPLDAGNRVIAITIAAIE